jgi:Sugar (and other) transporter
MAAIGGMLFGYDIGVISGAENLLKSAFRLSSGTEELAVAAVSFSLASFVAFRILTGVAVGASSLVVASQDRAA